MNLKSWLRRSPPAAKLRFDGKRVFVVGQGKNKWRDAENAIASFRPTLLECLNEEEHVLRVTTLDGGSHAEEDEEAIDDAKKKSEKVSELAALADIITKAADRAAERHESAYRMAFDKNYELVQVLSDRMSGLESAWQETIEARAQQVEEEAERVREAQATGDPAEAAVLNLFSIADQREKQNTGVPKKTASTTGGKKK